MIIVLVGESASGKSTVENLIQERKPGIKKIVTYTTRPKRDGEQDGIDYHFVTDAEFEKMKRRGAFIESATYRGWNYGSAKRDFKRGGDIIVVLTPHGCRSVKKWASRHPFIKVVSVYFDVDRRSRLIKLLQRGDNIDEAYRRNLSDVGQFDGFADEADYII